MGGLLYKDFTEIKGKGILILLAVLSLAFAVFRVVFAGTNEILELMVTDSMRRTVNLADIFLTSALGFFLIYLNYLINYTVKRICAADEKSKVRGYIFAGPLTKETYIASKYVFIGIMTYIFFSLYEIWSVLLEGNLGEDFYSLFNSIAVVFFSFSLLIAAIELLTFLLWGVGRATMIKIAFIMFIGILVIGYVLFGNLDVFEKLDIEWIISWANAHAFELMLANILSPAITLILYYISYRITVTFYERKEREYD